MKIYELKYSNTNTYLIEGDNGRILFDTGWAGTFPDFCRCMGVLGIPVQSIGHILISHFHPDHMGIAQEIAELGPGITVADVQQKYIHAADDVYVKEKNAQFVPIDDERIKVLSIPESRAFLEGIGIHGELFHTPGHSEDSISLWLDSGELFVGDLNPLYELELHQGTQIESSWNFLLSLKPKTVYYGHAAKADLSDRDPAPSAAMPKVSGDLYDLVSRIMRLIDKGVNIDRIQKKTGADKTFIEGVARMYLTHQNISVQGILDRLA